MIDALAQKLQAVVKDLRGVDVEIVDHRRSEAPRPITPAIRLTLWSSGDIYSGGTYTDEIELMNMPPPDIGAAIAVHFTFAMHDLSGQCDRWRLRIDGATHEEVVALRAVFAPAQYSGHWGNNMSPELVVDDVAQTW